MVGVEGEVLGGGLGGVRSRASWVDPKSVVYRACNHNLSSNKCSDIKLFPTAPSYLPLGYRQWARALDVRGAQVGLS